MIYINWIAVGSAATVIMALLTLYSIVKSGKQYKDKRVELKKQTEEDGCLQRLNVFEKNRSSLSIVNDKGEHIRGADSFRVALELLNSSNEYLYDGSPDYAVRFYMINERLLNVKAYYGSMLCLLEYVEHSSIKEHYYSMIWNLLWDSEKKWLGFFCNYCSNRSYEDCEALKNYLNIIKNSVNGVVVY